MSLLATRVQEFRIASPEASKYTTRTGRAGCFDAFVMGNSEPDSIITPEMLEKAAISSGRDIKVPVFDSETVTVATGTRPVVIADDENTSALMSVTKTIYSWGFTIVPARYGNNEIKMQQDFNRKFKKYLDQIIDDLDAAAASNLNTNKSQVFADTLVHTNASNVIQSTQANKDRLYSDLSVIMKANKYFGAPYRLITNAGGEAILRQQEKYGQFNEVNKTLEYADKTQHFSQNISNGAGVEATGYMVNSGSLGVLFTHEADSILRTQLADGTEWGIDTLPVLNVPISTYYYEGRADKSALGGAETAHLERTAVQSYGFSMEVALINAYIDDLTTVASPIVKWEVTTA